MYIYIENSMSTKIIELEKSQRYHILAYQFFFIVPNRIECGITGVFFSHFNHFVLKLNKHIYYLRNVIYFHKSGVIRAGFFLV